LQSFVIEQPHACEMQSGPGPHVLLQLAHTPLLPQVLLPVPALQVPVVPPVMLQHPPLHVWLALHVVVHAWVVVLHAYPVGQSLLELQPHVSVPRHACPGVAVAVQSTQLVAATPHALGAVPG
jgi:hypothetical protein